MYSISKLTVEVSEKKQICWSNFFLVILNKNSQLHIWYRLRCDLASSRDDNPIFFPELSFEFIVTLRRSPQGGLRVWPVCMYEVYPKSIRPVVFSPPLVLFFVNRLVGFFKVFPSSSWRSPRIQFSDWPLLQLWN